MTTDLEHVREGVQSVYESLQKVLTPDAGMGDEWAEVLDAYNELKSSHDLADIVMDFLLKDGKNPELKALLAEIRDAERAHLEIRVAQANKIAPQDVTQEHMLSYADLLSSKDTALKRVARANCQKAGRKLLQKYHPDKGNGSNRELFELCKAAIDSGDVELVHLLSYRLTGASAEAPDVLLKRIHVRTAEHRGSRVYSLFQRFPTMSVDVFVELLMGFLNQRLDVLKRMNIPGAI